MVARGFFREVIAFTTRGAAFQIAYKKKSIEGEGGGGICGRGWEFWS